MNLVSFTEIGKIHTKIYKNDIPWRFPGIRHVSEWRILAWVTIYTWFYCFSTWVEKNDLLSWDIRSPVLQIQIMRIFSHPRAEIYEKILYPRFVPVFRFWEWNSPPIISKMLARERMTLEGFWKKIRNLRNQISKMRYRLKKIETPRNRPLRQFWDA